MKLFIKKIVKMTLICLAITISSCEKDLYQENTNTHLKKIKSRVLSLDELPQDIIDCYRQKTLPLNSGDEFRSSELVEYPIFDEEKIIEIIDIEGNKNYSFRFVFENSPNNVFYVFLINVLPTEEKNTYIYKYTCFETNYNEFKNNDFKFEFFKGKIDLNYSSDYFRDEPRIDCPPVLDQYGDPIPFVSGTITSGGDSSGGNNPIPNQSGNTIWNLPFQQGSISGTWSWSASSSASASSTSTPSGFIYFNYYNPLHIPQVDEDHDPRLSDEDCPKLVPTGLIGMPTSPSNLEIIKGKLGLTIDQFRWIRIKTKVINNIAQYLLINNYSQASLDFVNDAINDMMNENNTVLNVDTLDDQITANLEPCLYNILTNLKTLQNGKFGQVIKQFVGLNPVPQNFNWNVESETLSGVPPPAALTESIAGNLVNTKINDYYLNMSTNLSFARTMIHEAFHAYLLSVYRHQNIDKSYVNLINQYSIQFNTTNVNDLHHIVFAQNNITSFISQALMEYGASNGFSLTQQYCDDMAWAGLLGTQAYNNLPQTQRGRIESRLQAETFNNNNNPLGTNPVGVQACP